MVWGVSTDPWNDLPETLISSSEMSDDSVSKLAEAIRTTVVPIWILIRTTVVPITPLIGTTVMQIRILIGTTGI